MTQAAALRVAFPEYVVSVRVGRRDKPRFEVVSREGGDPYCLISSDAQEIWQELRGSGGVQLLGRLVQGIEGGLVESGDRLGAQVDQTIVGERGDAETPDGRRGGGRPAGTMKESRSNVCIRHDAPPGRLQIVCDESHRASPWTAVADVPARRRPNARVVRAESRGNGGDDGSRQSLVRP